MGAILPAAVGRAGLLFDLLTQFRLVARLLFDSRVPLLAKLIVPAAGLWVLSPIDLMPDVLVAALGMGAIDDLVIVVLALRLFLAVAPKEAVAEHAARIRSRRQATRPAVDAQFRVVNE